MHFFKNPKKQFRKNSYLAPLFRHLNNSFAFCLQKVQNCYRLFWANWSHQRHLQFTISIRGSLTSTGRSSQPRGEQRHFCRGLILHALTSALPKLRNISLPKKNVSIKISNSRSYLFQRQTNISVSLLRRKLWLLRLERLPYSAIFIELLMEHLNYLILYCFILFYILYFIYLSLFIYIILSICIYI